MCTHVHRITGFCHQVRLAPGALASLSQLTSLHLADLDWRTVDRELVQWAGLQTLDLAYNPLECDCHLAWLREVIRVRTERF